jgi:hypothetical protein
MAGEQRGGVVGRVTAWARGATFVLAAIAWVVPQPCAAAVCPSAANCDPALLAHRTLSALRISGPPPVIDGRLDEAIWSQAPLATGFIQSSPRPAAPATLRSEARVLVDDEAIYIGLTFYDPGPKPLTAPIGLRDDEGVSDWGFVEIDSRHDRRSGFSFGVNPRGVQVDGVWSADTNYDSSWNAVWQAAAQITSDGWTAEIRIPFSQLAFTLPAGGGEMTWGFNVYRTSPGHGETSNWSPRYAGLGGVISQFNDIRVPAPPHVRRLEVTPYVAPRLDNSGPTGAREASARAGADFKVGLGPNFTLTATVEPDFGQVEADPSQVNLTAFELFQPEQRPFFLEGLEVYYLDTSLPFSTRTTTFADESPFYSRRVGRTPEGTTPADATVLNLPTATNVLGAMKLSGQTPGGWTLGAFSAVTDPEQALIADAGGGRQEWPVEARAASTVARALHSFDHGESSLGFFASDLHRLDLGPVLGAEEVRDAASVGAEVQHRFGGGTYEVRSWALFSRLTGDQAAIEAVGEAPNHFFQRPDAPELHGALHGTSLDGMATETRVSRVQGALLWDLEARAVSPGFDVNQLGYQRNSDWLLLAGAWSYQRYRPGQLIRHWIVGSANLGLGWTWAGESQARVTDVYAQIDTRSYWQIKASAVREMSALSTDWLRGGPALRLPPRSTFELTVATDSRQASFGTLDARWASEPASGTQTIALNPLLNVRSSDKIQWSIGPSWESDVVGWQPVGSVTGVGQAAPAWIVANLRQQTLALTLRGDLAFSPHLALQAYVQPFASVGRYLGYQQLVAARDPQPGRRFSPFAPGAVIADPATGLLGFDLNGDGTIDGSLSTPDGTRRTLNGDLVLHWEYAPGSFLTAVWNQHRDTLSGDVLPAAASDLRRLFGDRPTNALLIKISRRFS